MKDRKIERKEQTNFVNLFLFLRNKKKTGLKMQFWAFCSYKNSPSETNILPEPALSHGHSFEDALNRKKRSFLGGGKGGSVGFLK